MAMGEESGRTRGNKFAKKGGIIETANKIATVPCCHSPYRSNRCAFYSVLAFRKFPVTLITKRDVEPVVGALAIQCSREV
jgi:hypothetical protein